MDLRDLIKTASFALFLVIFIFLGLVITNYFGINLGKIEMAQPATLTIVGEAKSDKGSDMATFYASVTETNDDKQKAIDDVNTKMTELITKVKSFGIDEKDIQTQNVSVNEIEKDAVEPQVMMYQVKPGTGNGEKTWQASNSITIKLRDINKAQSLTDLLHQSGATDVSGPNYGLEDANKSSDELMVDAINDAKTKAEKIAKASGRRLGKIITVNDNGGYPIYPVAYDATRSYGKGGGTSAPVEPGSQTVYKSVTVLFELR